MLTSVVMMDFLGRDGLDTDLGSQGKNFQDKEGIKHKLLFASNVSDF